MRSGASLGPAKVLRNTIRGLELIGVNVSLNGEIHQFDNNWIHDDLKAYAYAVATAKPILFGPNLVSHAEELPFCWKKPANGSICLVPSEWVEKAWGTCNKLSNLTIETWAAGIDTKIFSPLKSENKKIQSFVLIYFKNRNEIELDFVVEKLKEKKITYRIYKYGTYDESEYLASLRTAKYAIWLSGTESQGFAMMEALSTNLPMLVLDCLNIKDNYLDESIVSRPRFPDAFYKIRASSSPYFDVKCGIKIELLSQLEKAIEEMEKRFYQYSPREYILDNHSLTLAAEKLIVIIKKIPIESNTKPNLLFTSKIITSLMYFSERLINGSYVRAILARLRKCF